MEEKGKRTKERLPGYAKGFAVIGLLDAAVYDFMEEFGLYFLTSIARLGSGVAGTIISIGTLINAILSPIIGYVSDRCPARIGRRRIFIIIGGIGTVVALPIMLIPMDVSGAAKVGIYGAAVLVFWTSYTIFYTPYLAYGADMTTRYDERSTLRTWVTMFNNLGTAVAYVLGTSVIALFMGLGMTEHVSWLVAVMIICGVSLACLLIGFFMTKGHDKPAAKEEEINVLKFVKDMILSYASALKLKTLRIAMLITFFAIIGYTIRTNGEMFMLTYCCGLSAGAVALYYLIGTGIISVVRPIPTKWFLDWFGKKGAFIICVALAVGSGIYYAIVGMDSFADAIIYGAIGGFILDGYWQIMPAMIYDIPDVDEYFYRKKREGVLTSFQALVEGIGASVGTMISGMFLVFYDFNEDAAWEADELGTVAHESARGIEGVLYLSTILPAIFFGIAALLVLIFPISKKRHEKLRKAIDEGVHADDNNPEYEDLKVLN